MSTSVTSPRLLVAAEHRETVLKLRKEGRPYKEIAQQVGLSRVRCYQIVKRELARIAAVCREEAEEVRDLELSRLDALQVGLWERAVGGDIKAVEAVLKLMERRARLLGLD